MLAKASKPRHRAERPTFVTQYAGNGVWVLALSPRRNCELTQIAPAETVAHGHGCQARPKLTRCWGISGMVLPAGTVSVPGGSGVARSTCCRNVACVKV